MKRKTKSEVDASEPGVSSDVTERDQKPQLFKPGQSGNPAGRPKGSRSRLNEKFLIKLERVCDKHGDAMMEKAAVAEPMQFLKMWAGLQPANVEARMETVSLFATYNLQDPGEFLEAYRLAKTIIGAEAPAIENDLSSEQRDAEYYSDD
jgi:hypothetical protein